MYTENTITIQDYKLHCLEIASRAGISPEQQLRFAKDMYTWLEKQEFKPQKPTTVC